MKRILFLAVCIPWAALAQSVNPQNPVRFLALGDSYTIGQSVAVGQRWPNQLMDSLVVRGFTADTLRIIATTGWRTDNLLSALINQNLSSQNYNLVSLLIGVNNQYQNRPISQYLTEFPQLLDSAIRYAGGDTHRVFIVSIPDYAFTPFGQQSGNAAQISTQIDQYNLINKQFAGQYGIAYFDITPISRQGIANPNLVAADGLHPSGLQYTRWVEKILHFVDSLQITRNAKSESRQTLEVWPNPAHDEITIHSLTDFTPDSEIELMNSAGYTVLSVPLVSPQQTLHLAGFPKGIYLLKSRINGKHQVTKIIRQ